MATPDVRTALKVSGRLCWNPTSLAGSYPFGGTALGLMRGCALKVREYVHVVRGEDFGGAPVDAVYSGEEFVLLAILSGWDSDAIETLSVDAAAGAVTGRALLRSRVSTDGVRAGSLVSDRSGILYFAPDNDQHPGVLFLNALPMRVEASESVLNLSAEFGTPYQWLAVPDDDGDVAKVGLKADLTL